MILQGFVLFYSAFLFSSHFFFVLLSKVHETPMKIFFHFCTLSLYILMKRNSEHDTTSVFWWFFFSFLLLFLFCFYSMSEKRKIFALHTVCISYISTFLHLTIPTFHFCFIAFLGVGYKELSRLTWVLTSQLIGSQQTIQYFHGFLNLMKR